MKAYIAKQLTFDTIRGKKWIIKFKELGWKEVKSSRVAVTLCPPSNSGAL